MNKIFKIITLIGIGILLLFILDRNKEIRQYQIQEQHHLLFLDTLQLEINNLEHEIKNLLKQMDSMPDVIFREVRATMYHPVEEQCDSDPLITADGSIIDPHKVSEWNWVAVSPDLLKKNGGVFNYGDQIYISGTHKDGIYTIHDCMNKRKRNQIDILESIGTSQYKYDEIEIFALNDLDV